MSSVNSKREWRVGSKNWALASVLEARPVPARRRDTLVSITLAPHRPHSNCLRSFLFRHQSLVPRSFSLNRPRYTSRIQFGGSSMATEPPSAQPWHFAALCRYAINKNCEPSLTIPSLLHWIQIKLKCTQRPLTDHVQSTRRRALSQSRFRKNDDDAMAMH